MKKIIPVLISAGGLLLMALIGRLLQNGTIPLWIISQHQVVNFTFTMQFMVLPISFMALVFMYLNDRTSFKLFFRIGITSRTESGEQASWKQLGPLVALGFTVGLMLLMSMGVAAENGKFNETFFKLLPLVLLFAAMNAWSEEIFSRFVLVAGLHDKLKPATICWISAILFGTPHFFGTPSGIFGVITSGLLGWLLAKSVIETRGLGWALFIHFLQDVVIFGAGAMIIAGSQSK